LEGEGRTGKKTGREEQEKGTLPVVQLVANEFGTHLRPAQNAFHTFIATKEFGGKGEVGGGGLLAGGILTP